MTEPLPRFRADLDLLTWPGHAGAPPACFARDPRTRELFELGPEGFFLCQKLDGVTTHSEILDLYQEKFGVPLAPEDLEVFLRQLRQHGLLVGTSATPRRLTFPEIFDPEIFLPQGQVPLLRGDRPLALAARCLGFLFHRPTHLLAGAAVAWALYITVTAWSAIYDAVLMHWELDFLLLLLGLSCAIVQSPRALIHGVLCKRYGGQVSRIGVGFLYYLLPSLYCDWSGVIWVRGKNRRMWVIASGIYYQVLLWAISSIGWWLTRPGSLPNTVWLALLLGSGACLLIFDGNPLAKMDAYLLMVNWIEVPRLRERSLAAFGTWLTRQAPVEALTRRQGFWFTLYGGLCFLYGMMHIAFHLWWAWKILTPLYEGAGAIATLFVGLYLFQKPLFAWCLRLRAVRWLGAPGARHRLVLAAGGALAVCAAIALIPYPYETGGPLQLLPARRVDVRTEVEGIVAEVMVREGDWVEAGQPLARLEPREQEKNLKAAQGRLDESRARLRLLEAGPRPEEIERAGAAVRVAEAGLDWSRPTAERYTALYMQRLVSEQEYENALRRRDTDAQHLEEARAELRLVSSGARPEEIDELRGEIKSFEALVRNDLVDVARSLLTSPIAGRVATPRVEEIAGTYLEPGQRDLVMQIEDSRTVRAEVEVPEADVAAVRLGAPVRVVTWAYHGTTFEGRVVSIAPVAAPGLAGVSEASLGGDLLGGAGVALGDAPDRAVRVVTEIPNPNGRLKSEMTGYAKIATGRRPLWDVLSRPLIRWVAVEVWAWFP
ncbi:MAG TPA: PqqD family peptide modification chaperone [Candidatus Polarisedimenticolia bacterium]|nr:PqqD family peptide modification chaperone [Candidatus Polarisedimenticolia bacterium]